MLRIWILAIATSIPSPWVNAQDSRPGQPTGLDQTTTRPASRPSPHEAVAAWLAADPTDVAARQALVNVVLDHRTTGPRALGRAIRKLDASELPKARRSGIELLLRDVALGYRDRVVASEMFFAGQYDPLEPLQPWIGRIYVHLLVGTPDWFPETMRTSVVPAVRDLFPDGPDERARDRLHNIATDVEIQPADLRRALSYAFAQWGDRSILQFHLDDVNSSIGAGVTIDELYFVRQLAVTLYQIRDYAGAAKSWIRFLRGREKLGSAPTVLDYYNSACCLSLTGDIPAALDELESCGKLMKSGEADESQHIKRSLFDTDPELRAIRPTHRFEQIVNSTYGSRDR